MTDIAEIFSETDTIALVNGCVLHVFGEGANDLLNDMLAERPNLRYLSNLENNSLYIHYEIKKARKDKELIVLTSLVKDYASMLDYSFIDLEIDMS
jgi:hypothetical protein